jgi:hypothetical protein
LPFSLSSSLFATFVTDFFLLLLKESKIFIKIEREKPLWCHLSSHGMMYVCSLFICAQQNQLMYYFLIAHAEKAVLHNRNPIAAIRFLVFVINSLLASKRILQILQIRNKCLV